jgi:enoyl-CoA hydratase
MSELTLSRPRPGVTQIILDRPDRLNAITYDLVEELHETLQAIRADADCRVVVLTGAGRGFCAGLDLTGYGQVPGTEDQGNAQRGLAVQQHIATLVPAFRSLKQPIIAAVNGPAAGGGLAMALASDIRIAGESARFGTAFVRLGLSGCDIGVSWMLPRLIGASRAWELMLTGRVIDSAEAHEIGLTTRVVPDDELLDAAYETAELITRNSPFGVWMTKEVMWSNLEVPSLQAGIDLENRTQILAGTTEDSRRAMGSFLSKEPVEYENR